MAEKPKRLLQGTLGSGNTEQKAIRQEETDLSTLVSLGPPRRYLIYMIGLGLMV